MTASVPPESPEESQPQNSAILPAAQYRRPVKPGIFSSVTTEAGAGAEQVSHRIISECVTMGAY